MRVSAKADYAIRAAVELAAAGEGPTKGDRIAQAQEIPVNFLENILVDLRNVLEAVTLADLAAGELPENVRALAADPDAWAPH